MLNLQFAPSATKLVPCSIGKSLFWRSPRMMPGLNSGILLTFVQNKRMFIINEQQDKLNKWT
jgi:hypothetical protein